MIGTDDNTQKDIKRRNPSRVNIVYKTETGGATEIEVVPSKTLILTDLGEGDYRDHFSERRPIELTKSNLNSILDYLNVKNTFSIPIDGKQTALSFSYKQTSDFEPASLLKQNEVTAKIQRTLAALENVKAAMDGNHKLVALLNAIFQDKSLVDKIAGEKALPQVGASSGKSSPKSK